MAKTSGIRTNNLQSLLKRKAELLAKLSVPSDLIRASHVKQFLTCGKKNCRCRQGSKHGPFHYLVQCNGTGKVLKFLLKTPADRAAAQNAIAEYSEFTTQLEELSRINTELLRRQCAPK